MDNNATGQYGYTPAGNPRRPRRSRRRTSHFWLGLSVFAVVLALFWIVLISYVRSCLVTYEKAQPEHVAQQVAQELKERGGDGVQGFQPSRFEDAQTCTLAYAKLLEGQDLIARQSSGSYDATAPVYDVYAGDTQVATVGLRAKSSRTLMLILTLQEWEVASVTPVLSAQPTYTITVPDTYTVECNGIPLDQREQVGQRREIEDFQYAANYVSVPGLVDYRLEGLFEAPVIRVLDHQGQEVTDLPWRDATLVLDSFVPCQMDPELSAYVLKNAKDYSNFFSSDLAGSVGSINPIRPMFPADSYYLDLAENYRRHDMWMYSGHNTPTFSGETVDHYIPYSDDFFSCEVYFDKKMILTRTGEERHDITHTRYYYVNLDGKWLIADMQQIIDD